MVSDFNQKESKNILFKPLADGVRHFKETEEGREIMCESVQTYAENYGEKRAELAAKNEKVNLVKNLMINMKLTLDQALNALDIQGDDRTFVTKQLQK